MGAWGTDLFDDDTALDMRADFEELLEDGYSVPEATARILEEYEEMYDDEEDQRADIYLILAALQMEQHELQPEIKARALEIIANGEGLELWADVRDGGETLAERKAVHEALRQQLLAHQNKKEAAWSRWIKRLFKPKRS